MRVSGVRVASKTGKLGVDRRATGRGNESQSMTMLSDEFQQMVAAVESDLREGAAVVVLGFTALADRLVGALGDRGVGVLPQAVFDVAGSHRGSRCRGVPVLPLHQLRDFNPDVVVIAEDRRKEEVLSAALPYIRGTPRVVIAGYAHFDFSDPVFHEEHARLAIPSLANGYPNSLIHLYQCLQNAARLDLRGVVVELGMYRGATTMFLSRVVERLGKQWPILGFDTFTGFPPRRSVLDMYDHPDLRANPSGPVRDYLCGRNVQILEGDIVDTCKHLKDKDLVLTFFDTDNYSPAASALEVVRERTVPNGAVVFDHFTGVDRFKYTLGERIAAKVLLDDRRFFNLHGTGVFYRQCL